LRSALRVRHTLPARARPQDKRPGIDCDGCAMHQGPEGRTNHARDHPLCDAFPLQTSSGLPLTRPSLHVWPLFLLEVGQPAIDSWQPATATEQADRWSLFPPGAVGVGPSGRLFGCNINAMRPSSRTPPPDSRRSGGVRCEPNVTPVEIPAGAGMALEGPPSGREPHPGAQALPSMCTLPCGCWRSHTGECGCALARRCEQRPYGNPPPFHRRCHMQAVDAGNCSSERQSCVIAAGPAPAGAMSALLPCIAAAILRHG
jgi:hypothetical protein